MNISQMIRFIKMFTIISPTPDYCVIRSAAILNSELKLVEYGIHKYCHLY